VKDIKPYALAVRKYERYRRNYFE